MTTNELIVKSGKLISVSEKSSGAKVLTVFAKVNQQDLYLRFICRKDLVLPKDMIRGKMLDIKGYCRAYSIETDGKWSTSQYFIAEEVTNAQPMLTNEFGAHGRYYENPSYSYKVCGTLVQLVPGDEWTKLTVRVDEDNKDRKVSYVHLNMNNKSHKVSSLKKNDKVCATCNLRTPKKTVNGKTICFEDIYVSDIASIS